MYPPPIRKKSMGCFTKLLMAIAIIVVLFCAAIVGAVYWSVQRLTPYLATEAIAIPDKPLSVESASALDARITAFQKAQQQGLPNVIVLTDTEINARLSREEFLKGHIYTRFENDRAYLYLSIPTAEIPIVNWFAGGKYLNAVIDFSPRIVQDALLFDIQRVWLNNEKLPTEVVKQLGDRMDQTFANRERSSVRAIDNLLLNVSEMAIRDGKLVVQTGGLGRVTGQQQATSQE
jgi:hypothetical protein